MPASPRLRFNYPYSEKGGGGMDGEKVRLATVRAAIEKAKENATDCQSLPADIP